MHFKTVLWNMLGAVWQTAFGKMMVMIIAGWLVVGGLISIILIKDDFSQYQWETQLPEFISIEAYVPFPIRNEISDQKQSCMTYVGKEAFAKIILRYPNYAVVMTRRKDAVNQTDPSYDKRVRQVYLTYVTPHAAQWTDDVTFCYEQKLSTEFPVFDRDLEFSQLEILRMDPTEDPSRVRILYRRKTNSQRPLIIFAMTKILFLCVVVPEILVLVGALINDRRTQER